MHSRIAAALTQLEATHDIRILYACEAGSRAWGFPSPTSDYDVRFIYAQRPAWHLTLDDNPDTLNFPVEDELDLAGWELRKMLRLLRGSNAALFEWLQSPTVYWAAPEFLPALQPLLPATYNLRAGLHHYLGLVRRGLEADLTGGEVRLKRLFYALRSALAARWIRTRHSLPPMEFKPLCAVLPAELSQQVQELLARKAEATEKTTIPQPTELVEFLRHEYAACQAVRDALPVLTGTDPTPELNQLFQRLLTSCFPA
ncbi:nucleotidyltransferase domain-containing protein [Hymenobacter cellulosilyticus]|uniref:Nucleotidyltransferase domain-containing protein n=1 Tax=Hymenobacter cellulosilyticus TaxID=2932248 RepID=A0A8T9QES3_9BACT|nr:nucleotidyltransferase domain-containing protein [Hymenobacter cellulosilyticus]UOQ74921.1 nucleotidyltransferase domain-containing protein [Hymenobacter cellulosilyticus]